MSGAGNALTPILERTRAEVAARQGARPFGDVAQAAAIRRQLDDTRDFAAALGRPGLSVIAEHKRSSPSAGVIREGLELQDVVGAYERGGAAALSVLTETGSFGGSLDDLPRARAATSLPILRKDFIVDPYQVLEAAAAGADAILLIVAALDAGTLRELHAHALAHGLDVLVEVHDAAELAVATDLGARIIGINNRDLTTLQVDLGRTFELLPQRPAGALIVAESGFRGRAELERLARAGVDAVLIGEALMRAADIEAACRALTGAPAPPAG
ncbi:MAG TPA: indole-3-glycerol phosphate synthase TrpC [Solirubrobacteraceae bacterium]|nr:indole-3-glycerol phosphate synthase TrpC [Solirubrobacteraceae bacterium]